VGSATPSSSSSSSARSISEQNLEEFLVSEGMKSGETDFMGHTDPKGPFMVVAEFGI
jgi:hypothetical protein